MQRLETKESSTIAAIFYDEAMAELQIQFKSGGKYAFDGVSKEAWDKFNMAESKGSHFAREIKPRFTGRKL